MRKKPIIQICFLLTFLILCSCQNKNKYPHTVKGIINLSHWNLKNSVSLEGNWIFYPNQLIHSEKNKHNSKINLYVPKQWKRKNKKNYHYGTYQITIKIPEVKKKLGLRLFRINTAYRLFINNKFIKEVGKVSSNQDIAKPQFFFQVIGFEPPSKSNKIQITLEVSNYHHPKGGIVDPIIFGYYENLKNQRLKNISFDIIVFGIGMIVFLLNFIFFIIRKKYKFLPYFAIYSLLISIRAITFSEIFITQIIPDLSWVFHRKLIILTVIMAQPVFLSFFKEIFFNHFNQKIKEIALISGLTGSILVLFLPFKISFFILILFEILSLSIILYIIFRLFALTFKKNRSALFFLITTLFLFGAGLNDFLYGNKIIKNSFFLTHIFLIILIISNTIYLSVKLSKTLASIKSKKTSISSQKEEFINSFDFTEREKEILRLLLKGLITKEIAENLNIKTRTIEKHIYNIYKKMKINSRLELIAKFHLFLENNC